MITLYRITTEKELQKALADPVSEKDNVLYAAARPNDAKALIEHGLPCIFIEHETGVYEERIYGADMIVFEPSEWDWSNDEMFLLRVWQRHYGIPWKIVETEHLWIRESIPEDFEAIYEFYQEERKNPDVANMPEEKKQAQEQFLQYIQNRYPFFGYGLWTVVQKRDGRIVGRMGFEETSLEERDVVEVSVLIGMPYRHKGYAKEGIQALLSYAKEELELEEVWYRTSRKNKASAALADALGFCCVHFDKENSHQYFKNTLTLRTNKA